ncbi:MAG: class I SAM-dependent methyltransferase [Solirubrobacteraceae bacterium]
MPGAHRESIIEQFTQQASGFAAAASLQDAGQLELMLDASRIAPRGRVLDVACGPGIVTCAFAQRAAAAVGLDLVESMLERAAERAGALGLANVEWVQGDVDALPWPEGAFDAVVSRFSLHHLEKPAAALGEMARVCARGGRLVICDLSPAPAKAEAFDAMERLRDPSHVRAFSEGELRELIAATGAFGAVEVAHTHVALELEAHLARSFPVDADAVRDEIIASLEDDHLGIRARRAGGRVEYSYSAVVLSAARLD